MIYIFYVLAPFYPCLYPVFFQTEFISEVFKHNASHHELILRIIKIEIATNIYNYLLESHSLKYDNQLHFAQDAIFSSTFLINLHRVNQFY